MTKTSKKTTAKTPEATTEAKQDETTATEPVRAVRGVEKLTGDRAAGLKLTPEAAAKLRD